MKSFVSSLSSQCVAEKWYLLTDLHWATELTQTQELLHWEHEVVYKLMRHEDEASSAQATVLTLYLGTKLSDTKGNWIPALQEVWRG